MSTVHRAQAGEAGATCGDCSDATLMRTGSLPASSFKKKLTKKLHRLQWPSKNKIGVSGTRLHGVVSS